MSTGSVQLNSVVIAASIPETLMGIVGRQATLRSVTIGCEPAAKMQIKVVNRLNEPIEAALCEVLDGEMVGGNTKDVLSLDGTDDYIATPDISYDIATSYSLEAWIKTTTDGMIIGRDVSGSNRFWQFRVLSSKLHCVRFNSSGGVVANFAGLTNINTGNWVHVAMSFSNASGTKLYVNGIEDGNNTTTTNNKTGTGEKPLIGARRESSKDTFFAGRIADVRIWETARTQQQISDNKDIRLNGDEAGLVGYWPLMDAGGSVATELVSGNNGTIFGAQWAYGADLPIPESGGTPVYTDVYDSGSTNANGLVTLDYKINQLHGLKITINGKRNFIMPFQRENYSLLDWQIKLDHLLASFITDGGKVLVNGNPYNNDNNLLLDIQR